MHSLKFKTDGFDKIVVLGRRSDARVCSITTNSLVVPFIFSEHEYFGLEGRDLSAYFAKTLRRGFDMAAADRPLPLEALTSALEELEGFNYRNEWTHQSKQFSAIGIRAELACALDQASFRLRLILSRNRVVVFDQVILETKPDEIIFRDDFKEVVLDGDHIEVRDRFDRSLFRVPVASLPRLTIST